VSQIGLGRKQISKPGNGLSHRSELTVLPVGVGLLLCFAVNPVLRRQCCWFPLYRAGTQGPQVLPLEGGRVRRGYQVWSGKADP
jgi:hypothetical protein